jgi:hypothetical protein
VLWLIASSAVAAEPTPVSREPLGIGMEGYDYPHPVKYSGLKKAPYFSTEKLYEAQLPQTERSMKRCLPLSNVFR